MWKYISSATILALSAAILPSASGNPSLPLSTERPSFEDKYVEPEMAKLKTCQSAKLPVYFNEDLIVADTRANFSKVANTLTGCTNYKILVHSVVSNNEEEENRISSKSSLLSATTRELSKHSLQADIDGKSESVPPNLILNGLGAYLSVEFD